MTRILRYLADHALGLLALAIGLLGLATGAYAAFTISGSQIRNHTIEPVKLDPRFIAGSVRAWAVVSPSGRLVSGAGRPHVSTVGFPGQYEIDWGVSVSRRCATVATVDIISSAPTETVSSAAGTGSFVAGYASAGSFSARHRVRRTLIETFNHTGKPTPLGFDVAVVC